MRRHALGIIGCLFIVAAIVLLAKFGIDRSTESTLASICLRAGLVLTALWLAFPQLLSLVTRFPPWMIGSLVIGLGALVWRPRSIVVVGPLLGAIAVIQFVGWLFKPLPTPDSQKPKSKSSSQK